MKTIFFLNQKYSRFFLILLIFVLNSCSSDSKNENTNPSVTRRSFNMGFTPWPFAATLAAQNEIYSFIDDNADLIAIHLDGGVPWPEALTPNNFDNYGSGVKNEINGITSRLTSLTNKEIYLGVSPFNGLRDDKALYWNTSTNESNPSPWDTYDFDNNFLVSAYANYVDEVIKKINPKYVNYAIEINEYYHNVPADRTKLQYFYINVYTILKNKYPDIIFMTSFTMSSPGSVKMQETADLFLHLKDYLDMTGISIYPYAFFSHSDKGDPANLPNNWLSQISSIAPGKPYFIAETGFVGESLSIPAFGLNVTSDENKQRAYLLKLFQEANNLDVEGIVWFSPYDFDDLWSSSLNDDLSLVWRDTGLKDGNQVSRAALQLWNEWLSYIFL